MKKVPINKDITKTTNTTNTEVFEPCKKKLIIATIPAIRKWAQIL